MSESNRTGLTLLAAALALGLLGDVLLREWAPGLNVFLWVAALAAVYRVLVRRGLIAAAGDGRRLLLPAVLLAAGFLWRGSLTLQFLDVMALAITLGLASAYARGGELRRAGIIDYALGFVLAGLQAVAGLVPLLTLDVKWNTLPGAGRRDRALAVLRGLVLALPLLLVFGRLFTTADAVFANIVNGVLDFNLDRLLAHALATLFWSWLAAGWLRASALGKGAPDLKGERPGFLVVGPIETGVVLGSLNLLFLAFVLVQFRYFFGGTALVQATTGLTYAEYARRGFFELVAVSALVLPVLLLGHWLQPPDRPAQQRLFRWLATSLLCLLFVIMASALQRMLLYQRQYGLTELRLYTTAFMAWLGVLFAWFLATVLRGHRERFAFGVLISGLVVLAALHVLNPDAFIARTNLARVQSGQPFDAYYTASLGADAVPVLVEALPGMDVTDRQTVTTLLHKNWTPPQRQDWQSWNWARMKAWDAVQKADLD